MRLVTAGESHGKGILAVIEGTPAGLRVDLERISKELERRRRGYGRGERMRLEKDEFEFISGVINNVTTGAPISVLVKNTEWEKWRESLFENPEPDEKLLPVVPRPGHADYSGVIKYGFENIRPVIERSSARTTVAFVAAGAVLKTFLSELGIEVRSLVAAVGEKEATLPEIIKLDDFEKYEKNDFRTLSEKIALIFKGEVDKARESGTTVGGIAEVWAFGAPPGLGSYVSPFERIDSKIAALMMAIPSVKAVEIGSGVKISRKNGFQAHDEFLISQGKVFRRTNHSGGIEGGMTNGEAIRVRLYVKPIPTQASPLRSVNLKTMEEEKTFYERSDVCVVPAVGVIGESMISFALAEAILDKFGRDTMKEIKRAWEEYLRRIPWSPRRESHL